MKSVIVYYSFSGNTRAVAHLLLEYLNIKGQTDILRLKDLEESERFFVQLFRAFIRKRTRIQEIIFDLSGYDLICLGTPIWAFSPAPAINTYLDKCSGLAGKSIVLFSTYDSGAGNERCLKFMQEILIKKGGRDFKRFSIQQARVKDKELVLSKIKEAAI